MVHAPKFRPRLPKLDPEEVRALIHHPDITAAYYAKRGESKFVFRGKDGQLLERIYKRFNKVGTISFCKPYYQYTIAGITDQLDLIALISAYNRTLSHETFDKFFHGRYMQEDDKFCLRWNDKIISTANTIGYVLMDEHGETVTTNNAATVDNKCGAAGNIMFGRGGAAQIQ